MDNSQSNRYQFTLSHDIKDIDRLEEVIDELKSIWAVDEKSLFQLNLVLEELISNTMFYGFTDKESGVIDVDLYFDGSHIHVNIHDDATAFDPTRPVDSEVSLELNERQIGGLGIILSQRISEDMNYEYHQNKNKLKFKINTKANDKS